MSVTYSGVGFLSLDTQALSETPNDQVTEVRFNSLDPYIFWKYEDIFGSREGDPGGTPITHNTIFFGMNF